MNRVLAASACVFLAAIVAMLGVQTYFTVTDHQKADLAAAEAKKSEVNKSLLIGQVTAGVQRMIDSDDSLKGYHIQVLGDMALFQMIKGGTEFRGMVTAQTPRGTNIPIEITAYSDKDSLMYEIDGASHVRMQQTASKEQPDVCPSGSC